VLDYLVEEVLQQQPDRVRTFFLQTSILERLSGPLCEAITGHEDSRGMLETLERGNLFVVPLDHERQWYRYHHLFANVLQARAMEEQPDQVPTLHLRASEWHEHNSLPADAIRHALAAGDFERAAGLIELAWPAMDRSFQSAAWLGWAKMLPDELIRTRPVLSVGYARALLDVGELEAVDARLRDAERWLDKTAVVNQSPDERPEIQSAEMSVAGMVVVDEEQFRSLPATIDTARAYHAQARGDMSGAVKYARQALDLLPEGYYYERGVLAAHLGVAYWAGGDLEAAHRSFADFMANMRMAGNVLVAISGTFIPADIRMAQGRLHEAIRTYERSLQLAMAQGEPVLQGTADLYLELGELQCERGDLETARQHRLKSKELGEHATLPTMQYRSCVAEARIKEAEGDLDSALDLLDEAERQQYLHAAPDIRPVAALKTRVWIAQGMLSEALDWAREQGLSAHDELSYLREFEHITLARVLIARYRSERIESSIHEAMELLERLLQAAEEGGRSGSVIEILVLQALAHKAQGDNPTALSPLERALSLAEPEGYVRIFVDEGLPMARLLYEALSQGVESDYIRRLLAAFPVAESEQTASSPMRGSKSELVEPLSERELEVLQLIAEGLTNQEVATRLYLSLHTVKVHARNIFTKLAVKNRAQAVARGRALGILSQT
ncbi:MAG: LuxR C-terminal-related transcriptional regulator, partial [Chloroflexota bacterium]|nr:LuxR C-terminal-related transcriptional regulator [Chloroflexota bacterium]